MFIYNHKDTFITNKYTKWYYSIIIAAGLKNRKRKDPTYYECHHILPKSIFPEYTNLHMNKWNKVLLTAKEHFICHLLLTKMVKSDLNKAKMNTAIWNMVTRHSHTHNRYKPSSRLYEQIRNSYRNSIKGRTTWNKGIKRTQEEKLKISMTKLERHYPAHNLGIPHKESTIQKIKERASNRPKIVCEYCETESTASNYKRWHGENCRHKDGTIPLPKTPSGLDRSSSIKQLYQEGRHPSNVTWTCSHCSRIGQNMGMFNRWHGENCKLKD